MTFGPTDYWYAGDKNGKCGPYAGQCNGRDAATEIQSKANYSIPKIAVYGGTVYYTDYSYEWFGGAWQEPNPNYQPGIDDPLMEYLFYWTSPAFPVNCLSPDVMNFYLTNVKNWGHNNIPAGKEIVSYECYFTWTIGMVVPANEGFHEGRIEYGIRHIKPNPHVTD